MDWLYGLAPEINTFSWARGPNQANLDWSLPPPHPKDTVVTNRNFFSTGAAKLIEYKPRGTSGQLATTEGEFEANTVNSRAYGERQYITASLNCARTSLKRFLPNLFTRCPNKYTTIMAILWSVDHPANLPFNSKFKHLLITYYVQGCTRWGSYFQGTFQVLHNKHVDSLASTLFIILSILF